MGRSTNYDIMPFAARSIFCGDTDNKPIDDRILKMAFEEWHDQDDSEEELRIPIGLWVMVGEAMEIGSKKNLYATEVRRKRDGKTVWLLNESYYSNIGAIDLAVCANSKDAILAFLLDFADVFPPDAIIDEQVALEQTI